jgi:hypothetical protein
MYAARAVVAALKGHEGVNDGHRPRIASDGARFATAGQARYA